MSVSDSSSKGKQLHSLTRTMHIMQAIRRCLGCLVCWLQGEAEAVDRAITKVAAEARTIEEEMLAALSEQTTAEKASGKTAADTGELRKKIRAEELALVETENEMAKLQVGDRRCYPLCVMLRSRWMIVGGGASGVLWLDGQLQVGAEAGLGDGGVGLVGRV